MFKLILNFYQRIILLILLYKNAKNISIFKTISTLFDKSLKLTDELILIF